MKVKPRRPLNDDKPNGYLESDKDFILNNLNEAVRVLEGPNPKKRHVTRDMLERRLTKVEKALKECLEVARCAFPQDSDGSIIPIPSGQWERLKLWDKYVKAMRVSERPLR